MAANRASYEVNGAVSTEQLSPRSENDDESAKYDDVKCGYGSCKPERLQKCNNPKLLLAVMCVFAVSQGFVVNGVNNVNTQAVERRFRLPSSRSGLISSSYDFSAAIFGVVISFAGSGRYKGRWLSVAAFVMGLGSFTMALPHFTTGLYDYGQNVVGSVCATGVNATSPICEESGLQNYLGVLMLGMIFHGVGGCVLYTIGVGYLDDSVAATSSPLYLGILYGFAALGPGLGYIVGGQFLDMYVDVDKVDTATIDLKKDDPRWVGAWWVGFFITMATCWLIVVPLSMFGAELPSAKRIRESRISQMHKGDHDESGGHGTNKRLPIKMFPKVTCELLRNAPFVFTILAGASEGVLTSGFATFVPKYIQNKFGVSSGMAALYTGAAAVPGAAGGMFFGGFICNRLKLKVRGMFKFAIFTCFLTIIAVNILWISCEELSFAGVNQEYETGGSKGDILSACNQDCGCITRYFNPVCSSNGVQYFTACHAGCDTEIEALDGTKSYTNCSCVPPDVNTGMRNVTSGTCDSGCSYLYLFIAMFFVTIFVTFLPSTPSDAATLRCIHEDHRTFSMGLKWLFIRLLGTVPGPVIFGAVTDTACLIWQDECGKPSSCWIYDNSVVSRNYFLIAIAAKALSMIFFILAFVLYKPPPEALAHSPGKIGFSVRESAKKKMSFVTGSFKEGDYEHSILQNDPSVEKSSGRDGEKTTNL
ncbi:solute carrier organic anion transporter family member 4C1-like [Mya arenaria]|uniref:solute carrier organic anion transporter family member 4C1-like n=1 Tax=Mya arenaria TaxID=6604 RepID=UPI0022E5EC47|nr:solute carrier organic anion transporter family member 4C1-like [Mya arenaria]XP_052765093.1 solute carrier organic anion transporter family member 4C1-like [Mya arenaria]XP_052765095.1 solute carrier organic anion transporter family member 4C1-like [Mya arenaria]XP_052765096.1 solute carrier organic anion transporter family member 4C1-like [Mya arenaria]